MPIRTTTRPYKTYEELAGAEGRQVFFRAERYQLSDVFGQHAPDVVVHGVPLTLNDFSMTGISALGRDDTETVGEVGEEVPIVLRTDGVVLHEGRGLIRRIEPTPFRTKFALEFTIGHLDIAGLLLRHRSAVLRGELGSLRNELHDNVSEEYRAHCSDTLHFLSKLRATLQDYAPTEAEPPTSGEESDAELLSLCEEAVLPAWRRLWHRGNELVRPLCGPNRSALETKRYTELVLTPAFVVGPIWQRSFEKPRGYPGDFELMKQVYEWRLRGETPYEKVVHRVGLDVAECIGTRMTMVENEINDVVWHKAGDEPVRALSLGSGPAQEALNCLKREHLDRAVHFTLIDQDHDALADAYNNAYPELARHANGSAVHCMEVSFAQLLRGDEVVNEIPPQDLIYSLGLIDYLSPSRARALVVLMYAKVAPGGRLIVANMRDVESGNLWPMEFICDWRVQYRSESDMFALADGLDYAEAELTMDPTGRVYMLTLHKM